MAYPYRLIAILTLAAVAAAACSGPDRAEIPPPPAVVDASLTAESHGFDRSELMVPADRSATLHFRNLDSTAHNVSIYTDSTAEQALFEGELINGTSITYQVPPLRPGTYHFRCDPHPSMNGSLIVE